MDDSVLAQLARLDGHLDTSPGGGRDTLLSLRFPGPLLLRPRPTPWSPTGLDVFDSLLTARPDLLGANGTLLVPAFLDTVFGDDPPGLATRLVTVRPHAFTPFTPGSADFGELDGLADEATLRDLFDAPHGELEFVVIGHSDGFPNHYLVRRGDPSPGNPAVWSTDHEVFFTELEHVGSLADFLAGFTTHAELAEYLRSARGSADTRS